MTQRAFIFLFAIVIIVIVSIIMFIVFSTDSGVELEQIKTVMIDKYVEPKYAVTATNYQRDPKATFENELKQKIENVVPFGIALLSMYQLDNTKTQYLEDVEDLIKRIDKKLGGPVKSNNTVPWGSNWYHCSISLTRLLAMYEYIGKDKGVMDICHRRIIQITPRLGHSLGYKRTDTNIILIGIPRLLTLKKNRPDLYEADIKTNEFRELQNQMNLKPSTDDVVRTGVYQDHSCIHNDNNPTFAAVAGLGGFYLDAYRELKYEENRSTFVKELLDKLLHPELDFIPYGLFGRYPKIVWDMDLRNHWPNYTRNPNYDVNIFPFIGLGVFKSPNFIFSLRVQRKNIAAYESDKWYYQCALGWIQMRKLYCKDINYNKYKSEQGSVIMWDKLKFQPGVISFDDAKNDNFDNFKKPQETETYFLLPSFCQDIRSYIGHLNGHKDRKLLYWFNKYKFEKFYGKNVEISERGVCTDNGLVMRYEIKNQSGKALKLILKDADIGNEMKIKPSVDDSGTGVLIPNSGEPKIVKWYQVFDDTIEPKTVDGDSANNSMSFTINGDMYVIEEHGGHHIVKCNGDIILAGNSSSLREGSITHHDTSSGKDTVFKRDSKTLMYVPQ
uniref:putative envelope protein ODV-E66-18 n=1 Tax=Microplitis demolitor TaxID=69319 RepID=UPI0031CCAD0E